MFFSRSVYISRLNIVNRKYTGSGLASHYIAHRPHGPPTGQIGGEKGCTQEIASQFFLGEERVVIKYQERCIRNSLNCSQYSPSQLHTTQTGTSFESNWLVYILIQYKQVIRNWKGQKKRFFNLHKWNPKLEESNL